METKEALVCAYAFDGKGGGREFDWSAIDQWKPTDGTLWIHLDRSVEESRRWLEDQSGLDPLVAEALLAEESRPRCAAMGDGLLVILRGVNLNPGADPEDMISIRIWVQSNRIISTRVRRLMAVSDIRSGMAAGHGPAGPGDFLVMVTDALVDRMGPVINDLDDQTDALEDEMLTSVSAEMRGRLANARRQSIALRRYLSPQRDAMARLSIEDVPWFSPAHRARLREIGDRVLRYVEDLDAIRERAAVVQDELTNRLSDRMNRTMYVLTVVASIMLPLGFVTGLLGINVGGIPGTDSPWGFAIVCGILFSGATLQIWLFHRFRWI